MLADESVLCFVGERDVVVGEGPFSHESDFRGGDGVDDEVWIVWGL